MSKQETSYTQAPGKTQTHISLEGKQTKIDAAFVQLACCPWITSI